jgi:hypothetical protein
MAEKRTLQPGDIVAGQLQDITADQFAMFLDTGAEVAVPDPTDGGLYLVPLNELTPIQRDWIDNWTGTQRTTS